MKRLKFKLAGQCSTMINGVEYIIQQIGDEFIYKNIAGEIQTSDTLNKAMASLRMINDELNPKLTNYKKTQSHKIGKLAIGDTMTVLEEEIYKVRPLVSYYKKTYNKIFSIEQQHGEMTKKYIITRCR